MKTTLKRILALLLVLCCVLVRRSKAWFVLLFASVTVVNVGYTMLALAGNLQAALAATRVFPEVIRPEEEAEKYTAHMWLQRMGYKGPEMKEQRSILLKHLHGYCAFSNGTKMQSHKDKYAALRRERREAERTATQTVAETITPATTEADPEKEVASNE